MLVVAVACAAVSAEQRHPTKTIEIVVSYAAGGSTDLDHAIAVLQDRLGQSVVVLKPERAAQDRRYPGGASGYPDGHTLYAVISWTEMAVKVLQLSKTAKYSARRFRADRRTDYPLLAVPIASKNGAATLPDLIEEPGRRRAPMAAAWQPVAHRARGLTASAPTSLTYPIAAARRYRRRVRRPHRSVLWRRIGGQGSGRRGLGEADRAHR